MSCHGAAYLEVVKMVNSMLYIFNHKKVVILSH